MLLSKAGAAAAGRRPQLDGVRAFAVAGVLASHYFLPQFGILALGGVKLFFVLSGFLITRLLLVAREGVEAGESSRIAAFLRFYGRRAARIFPLYYAVVTGALVVGLAPAREVAPWLATYTLNLHMLSLGWFVDRFAHFWSLAVEEQFYLVWPLVTLAAPRRWLVPFTLACVVAGPVWRGFALYRSPLSTYISPLACLDSLGLGALLALALHPALTGPTLRRLCSVPLLVGVGASLLAVLVSVRPGARIAECMLFDLGLGLVFSGVTRLAWEGAPGLLGHVFSLGPIAYVGQVSYGIYVLHPLVLEAVATVVRRVAGAGARQGLVALLALAVCLGAAALSWHYFERPVNELRNRVRWLAA
jgi:peptidoglycan/LPS O-acetylase OafA/YrhL